jgi:hypothetical protein
VDRYIFYGVATTKNADGSVKEVTISQMDETVSTNKNSVGKVWSRTKQTLDPATGILSEKDPVGSPYDASARAWYKKAKDSKGKPRWTSIYLFSSTGLPGITFVFPVLDKDGNWDEWETLVSIDIELSDLSGIATYAKLLAFGKRPNSTTTGGIGASLAKFTGGALASLEAESDVWDSSHIHIINKDYLLASTNPKFTNADMAGKTSNERMDFLSSNREVLEKERAVEAKKLLDSITVGEAYDKWTTFSQLKQEYVSKEDVGTPPSPCVHACCGPVASFPNPSYSV